MGGSTSCSDRCKHCGEAICGCFEHIWDAVLHFFQLVGECLNQFKAKLYWLLTCKCFPCCREEEPKEGTEEYYKKVYEQNEYKRVARWLFPLLFGFIVFLSTVVIFYRSVTWNGLDIDE